MKSIRRLISLCVLFVVALSVAHIVPLCAQEQGEPFVIGSIVTFRSQILGEERKIFVSLPDGYAGSGERYPVLYCLTQEDGGDIHYASGVARKMANARIVPRMIVIIVIWFFGSAGCGRIFASLIPTNHRTEA